MNKSRKFSNNNSKSNTDSFQSLKNKFLSDIENDSSQSDNFVSEPLDKEIQLVDNINNRINGNDSDYSDGNYYDDFYDSGDDYNSNNDYMDDYLASDIIDDGIDENVDSVGDEELLRTYVGSNYDKLVSKPFNIFGFLLTIFYMFYRKMYGYSLLIILILIAEAFFIKNTTIVLVTYAVLAVIIALTINKIYIGSAKKQVKKIKSKNMDMHYEEIKNICALNGGTDFRGAFSIFLIGCVAVFGWLFLFNNSNLDLKENINQIISNIFKKNNDKNKDHENGEYNGFISYDSEIKMDDNFSMLVPDVFVNRSTSYNYYYEYYMDDEVFSSCRLKFGSVLGYSDPSKLISRMIDYYSNIYTIDSPISGNKITINDIEWTWFSYGDSIGIRYFYATMINKKLYLFSYEIDDDSILSECEDYKKIILDSIESK